MALSSSIVAKYMATTLSTESDCSVATFHKLFDGKIKDTKALAVEAAKRYGLLPGLIE